MITDRRGSILELWGDDPESPYPAMARYVYHCGHITILERDRYQIGRIPSHPFRMQPGELCTLTPKTLAYCPMQEF